MRTRRTAGIVLVLLVSVAALALAACAEDTAPTENAVVTPTPSASASWAGGVAGPGDDLGAWMTGTWSVDFGLVSVTPDTGWARQAADQPSARWSCRVDGSEMVIEAGQHLYVGTFSVVQGSADEWLYDGEAAWTDDEGVTWTSHIVVEGVREGDDAFSFAQSGEISSSTDGTLYVAEWTASGTRVR